MHHSGLSVLLFLAVASLTCLATPLAQPWDDISVKHVWNAVPDTWECLGPPPPGITIDFHIALQPEEENILREALYEISTPGRPKYGKHLSKEEVTKPVEPHPDTLQLIHSWLAHHGVHSSSISTSHGGGWLTDVPVPQANELLGASYQLYQLAGTNDTAILRTVGYALPKILHAHVKTVAPTTFFASARTLQLTPHSHSDRDEDTTPKVLRRLYNTYTYKPTALTKYAIGVLGYGNEFPSPTDLAMFMSVFRPDPDPDEVTFTVETYAQAIAYPIPHIFYSIGGKPRWSLVDHQPVVGDFFLMWVAYLVPKEKIPQTMGASFGVDEKNIPAEYARSVCDIFMQLGARGVSILFSSGDGRRRRWELPRCLRKSPVHPQGPCNLYAKYFISDCMQHANAGTHRHGFAGPYVTTVGGTTKSVPEVGTELSGGGFSNYFERPPYQNVVVPAFLQSPGNQYDDMYNVQTVAGIISMLNDYLISKGKDPLGFLNPWLYTKDEGMFGLNDTNLGRTRAATLMDSPPSLDGTQFVLVTGLGTPDFFELLHVLFRTRTVTGAGNQRRIFSDIFKKNNSAATRDAKGIDEYFLINSSTRATPGRAHEQN
ncbi:subtilisin-like protein [Lactarius sanguifluus]|nr:subtilisin-like protein [Lactarius sanguifluus]